GLEDRGVLLERVVRRQVAAEHGHQHDHEQDGQRDPGDREAEQVAQGVHRAPPAPARRAAGLSSTWRAFTTRLPTRTMTAVTSRVPRTTGTSPLLADWSASWAMPGRLNSFSVITAPPMISGSAMPITASVGETALRSTCPKSTRRREKPRISAPIA